MSIKKQNLPVQNDNTIINIYMTVRYSWKDSKATYVLESKTILQYIQNMFSWIENNFAIHAKHVTSADSYRKCEWLILFNVIYHKIIGEYRIYNSKLAVF